MKKSEIIQMHKQIRNQFEFDQLKMLFCEDYVAQNGIVIREPRIGEILEVGEEKFYKNLNLWVTNPTSYRVALWHIDVDWCKTTDFELFCSLFDATEQDPNVQALLFPNVDFSTFEKKFRVLGEDEYELVLYSQELDEVIDNMVYLEISQYLRTLFNIFPKDEYGKGRATKEALISEDEQKAERESGKFKSSIFPLISSCINHPGFKHTLADLKNVGIYEFMDSVNRLQAYENTRALLTGSMSGFCDTSKVDKENFNFMRDLTANNKDNGNNNNSASKRAIEDYSKR